MGIYWVQGTLEITEPSEEIRLNLVTFLTSIISQSAAAIGPYLNDLVTILQRTLVDPYPEVKKVSQLIICVVDYSRILFSVYYGY